MGGTPREAAVVLSGELAPLAGLAASAFLAATLLPGGSEAVFAALLTLRPELTPAALLGRVSSLNTLATYGARPLGAALAAAVGALGGEVACLAFSAFCFVIQAIFLALSPIPALVSLRGPAER